MASGSPWGRKVPLEGKSSTPENSEFPALQTEIVPALSTRNPLLASKPLPFPKPCIPEVKPEASLKTISIPSKTKNNAPLKPWPLVPTPVAPSNVTEKPRPLKISIPEISIEVAGPSSTYAKAVTISPSSTIPAEKSWRSVSAVPPVKNVGQNTSAPVVPQNAGLPSYSRGPRSSTSKGYEGKGMKEDRPNPHFLENQTIKEDYVKSRSKSTLNCKKGEDGKEVALVANYFKLVELTDFSLIHYHCDFKPEEERTSMKKSLVKRHEKVLGAFIFDGQSLFSPHLIKLRELYSTNERTKSRVVINLKKVGEIKTTDTMFLQVYNLIIRNTMPLLGLELMGRHYFDPANKKSIPERKLEVWPGYLTSVRNHESEILLNLELTHKVVRTDTVLDFIKSVQASFGEKYYQKEVEKQLVESIIVTSYNNRTYMVNGIIWGGSPMNTFSRSGTEVNYVNYYKEQYGIIIKSRDQPLLTSAPKKKDYHKGKSNAIILIPELCNMTGLTESMRKDFGLMQEISKHLAVGPAERIKMCKEFVLRWYNNPKAVKELGNWHIKVEKEPKKVTGRVVPLDPIVLRSSVEKFENGDWTNVLKDKPMYSTVPLKNWVMIVPQKCEEAYNKVLSSLRTTAKSMGFQIDLPLRFDLNDIRPTAGAFVNAIISLEKVYRSRGKKLQMVVTILPTNNAVVYSAIKKKCYQDLGVCSQCILLTTIMKKNIVSITSRLAIQMNAKLGGEPWCVTMPRTYGTMVCGFDVFHSGNKSVPSIGALVTSTSPNISKYYVTTKAHLSQNELSNNLCNCMEAGLRNYFFLNQALPARIFLYRDGVGDGQLTYVYNTEMQQIQDAITRVYSEYNDNDKKVKIPPPKFSFIVVTKRIHARFMKIDFRGEENPPPGTVVDDVITLPERYDFFLVSQKVVGSGTVSPTSYNVLKDEQGISPNILQKFTLRLCQLYYNYSGTIAVPAPCQYAHKLAYLRGTSLSSDVHGDLQNYLYFL